MRPGTPSAWRIEFEQDAIRQLNQLDKTVRRRIVSHLERYVARSGNPRGYGKALKGPMRGLWSYRVGSYRVVCLLDDRRLVVVVVTVGHRSRAYR
jgi:mRNA interferase RelE/StbE